MSAYEKQHYVQKNVLKNFATKDIINIIDLSMSSVYKKNIKNAFYAENLYDIIGEDEKKLEKDLNENIEIPFSKILYRLLQEQNEISITRKELCTIKKYMLIQLYRNKKNSFSYLEHNSGRQELSNYNIQKGESNLDFWKREIQTILDNEWDDITKCNLVGVKIFSAILNGGFLMFFKTNSEFLINDIGLTIERIPVKLNIPDNVYIELAQKLGREEFGIENFDEIAKKEVKTNSSYIDNDMWFSFSPNFAIACVNGAWRQEGLMPKSSSLVEKYLSFPKNEYVNQKLITTKEALTKYKSQDDKYIYQIHYLNSDETIAINHLYLNEAFRYIGFKSSQGIFPSIQSYNVLKKRGVRNMKNDYEKIEACLLKF